MMPLIKRKLHDVEIAFRPLSVGQMKEVFALMNMNGNLLDNMSAGILALKFSLKELKGLKDYNDDEIVLAFDKDDYLKEDCLNLLVNCELSKELIQASVALVNGAPALDSVEGIKKLGK